MKNADMPAAPTEVLLPFGVVQCSGLNKREMMAMHAPEMPDWFSREWSMQFANDDHYFKSDIDEHGCAVREMTPAGNRAMYFAWCAHYADSLLAELAKGAAS